MKLRKITGLLILSSLLTTACGKKVTEESADSVDPVEASIESGVTVISGLSDDEAGSSYSAKFSSSPQGINIWDMMLGSKAFAESCQHARFAACNSGVRSQTYNGCELPSGVRTLSGEVDLTYSNTSCLLSSTGDNVVRTYDIDITGPRGGVVSKSSVLASDYRGESYGGGGRISKTVTGWDVEILGRHTSFVKKGRELYNVSVRTLSPYQISGSLTRSSRLVSGGQLEINHNLAKFTSVITPNNLQWQSSCCHPVSGSLTVTYTGSKTGAATVSFNGCGSASVNQDGQERNVEFTYCE